MISASHNPAEYNGIKIFDENGYKLGDRREELLEKRFIHQKIQNFPNIGTYEQDFNLTNLYLNYLKLTPHIHPDNYYLRKIQWLIDLFLILA